MDLSKILDKKYILTNLKVSSKEELLLKLFEVAKHTNKISNFEQFKKTVFTREDIQSTGLGRGLAIPHAATVVVDDIFVIVGICPQGIDFEAIDSQPCFCFFMIGSPKDDNREYLHVLATISRLFRQKGIIEKLTSLDSAEDVYNELLLRLETCEF